MHSTSAEHTHTPAVTNVAEGARTLSARTADNIPVDTVEISDVRTGVRTDGATSLSHGIEGLLQSIPVNKEEHYGQTENRGEGVTRPRLGLQVEVDKHSDDEDCSKERLKVDNMNHVWDDEEGDEGGTETEEEGDEEDDDEEEGGEQEGQYYEELQEEGDAGAEGRKKTYYKGECSISDSNSEVNSVSNEEKRSEAGVQDSPHLRYITP